MTTATEFESGFDLVVVGAGLAGTAAACRACELGRRVLLLDAATDPTGGGNTSLSGGALHIVRLGLDADPARLRRRILYRPPGEVREDLADLVAERAAGSLAWTVDRGVKFEPEPPGDLGDMFAPVRDLGDVHAWRDAGPQRALRTLQSGFEAAGGTIRGGARARELLTAQGAVSGVVLDDGTVFTATGVVLADGGFGANPELRRRYIGPAADQLFLRAAPNGQGDGLLMAQAAGAATSNLGFFYGHCLHGDVVHNDRLWPWPALDEILTDGGILVDRAGRRLADEGAGGVAAANVVARLDDPRSTFVVLDERIWADAGELVWGHLSTNPEIERRGGTMHRGDGPAALGAAAGIDPAGLAHTVAGYNQALESGAAESLPIPRTGKAAPLAGGLLAMPMIPGISHTSGGLVVDTAMRVLSTAGDPIPGLYAAGQTAAGPHAGYFGGLANALVQGLQAGQAS